MAAPKKKTPTTTKTPPPTTKTPNQGVGRSAIVPTTKKTLFQFQSPEDLATYIQQSVESSDLKRSPKEDEKCVGTEDKDGVEKMCPDYQPKTTTSNAEEFKTGHEEERNRLVSRKDCGCPSTETPKVGGKCPGVRCFTECVGPNQTLDKGYSTGVGICSNCNKACNLLEVKKDRSQREKLAEKKWPGKGFNNDAFAKTKKEANPLPKPRELHPYYTADHTCEMCDRLFVEKSVSDSYPKYNGEEGDVLDILGAYLLFNNPKEKKYEKTKYRSKVYKGIKRGISSLFGRNDDKDGAKAPVCVCDDCCGRIGGTLAVAFWTHLDLNIGPEQLVKKQLVQIGADSLKDVKFDKLKGKPIEMEIGYAWKNEEKSNELRAWDSRDFVKHYFPAAEIPKLGPVRLILQFQRESNAFAKNSSQMDYCADLAASLARLKYKDTGDSLVFPGSLVAGGVPFTCFICPDTCLRTGPMRGSLLARTQKKNNAIDKDVPGFKELLDSVNVALRGLDGKSEISILINSPADLTSSALNLLAVLQMIEEPARVHVVWKAVCDEKEGVGGTVCVSDLLYFLRNRVNFDEFKKNDSCFAAVKSACQNATAAAKFFGILWQESTLKSLRRTGASAENNERGRKRRFDSFPTEQNYGVMSSQPQGNPGPSQEEQDIEGADSQSNTDEISCAKLNKTRTFLLSWKQRPIERQRKGCEGEWFTINQLIGVKRRGEWCGKSDAISPRKKRTSLGKL